MERAQIDIEWLNLRVGFNDVVVNSLSELANQLTAQYPLLPSLWFARLDQSLRAYIPDYALSLLPGRMHSDEFNCFQAKRIFIFCNGHEDFVQELRTENELAHWGIAIPGKIAVAWHPSKYLIWHEALHLLNAKDCYNKFGINKCPNARCVMRRAPSRASCGDELSLCSKNVTRIERFATDVFHREPTANS